jgi:hypothetical protein
MQYNHKIRHTCYSEVSWEHHICHSEEPRQFVSQTPPFAFVVCQSSPSKYRCRARSPNKDHTAPYDMMFLPHKLGTEGFPP